MGLPTGDAAKGGKWNGAAWTEFEKWLGKPAQGYAGRLALVDGPAPLVHVPPVLPVPPLLALVDGDGSDSDDGDGSDSKTSSDGSDGSECEKAGGGEVNLHARIGELEDDLAATEEQLRKEEV